ncbi:tyrosine-protein phosphatase precursor, putative [Talaromyces stipitatus ATCC 10500]|uniref:Tyrosine-protein phosphatase, putative n=1 Tax=Talaromyces stipitatus (strain ATCC 10500 / CBS 375.48 / QM 6759 / NRRL 1006) TaxID=441959 RepID=B8MD83_TALSN|nr:tyrosine-protein phosphatase precursor, putative [Talaromyces stipitatus ATCC 10500]EED17608.1 tyrosine-protein phosphatase precursor, putative [Talaromyces stipitatus ATCC 10500]
MACVDLLTNHGQMVPEDPTSKMSVAAQVTAAAAPSTPSPPFIHVDGVPNFRDIGGYPITSSTSIRRNFIYRSALPTRITPTGLQKLTQDLRITTVYDLRSNAELRKDPITSSPLDNHEAVKVLHAPVFPERDSSPEQLAKRFANYMSVNGSEGFVAAYAEILRDGVNAYRAIFEHVRDRPRDAFLVHCTGGKDRTGVLVALLLLVAGVQDRDMIAHEYSLTEKGFDASVKAHLTDKIIKDMGMDPENRAGIERLLSARKENMSATIEYIERQFGGAEGYLKGELGFGDDDVERIRKSLVVEDKGLF